MDGDGEDAAHPLFEDVDSLGASNDTRRALVAWYDDFIGGMRRQGMLRQNELGVQSSPCIGFDQVRIARLSRPFPAWTEAGVALQERADNLQTRSRELIEAVLDITRWRDERRAEEALYSAAFSLPGSTPLSATADVDCAKGPVPRIGAWL